MICWDAIKEGGWDPDGSSELGHDLGGECGANHGKLTAKALLSCIVHEL